MIHKFWSFVTGCYWKWSYKYMIHLLNIMMFHSFCMFTMLLKQYHKPPIWEWFAAPIYGDDWGMVYYCVTHIKATINQPYFDRLYRPLMVKSRVISCWNHRPQVREVPVKPGLVLNGRRYYVGINFCVQVSLLNKCVLLGVCVTDLCKTFWNFMSSVEI